MEEFTCTAIIKGVMVAVFITVYYAFFFHKKFKYSLILSNSIYISIYFTIGVDSIFSYAFETLKVNYQILRFSWSYMQMDVLLLLLMEI